MALNNFHKLNASMNANLPALERRLGRALPDTTSHPAIIISSDVNGKSAEISEYSSGYFATTEDYGSEFFDTDDELVDWLKEYLGQIDEGAYDYD